MNHPQTVTHVRKHQQQEQEGHKRRPVEITCRHMMQKCVLVEGTAQNIEFYDAFMCFSGLKSTYPN